MPQADGDAAYINYKEARCAYPDWSWLVQQRAQTSWDPRERQRNQRFWFARELKLMRQVQPALIKAAGLREGSGQAGSRASVRVLSMHSAWVKQY